ncbi:hypothetical protein FET70_03390 [Lactiplantibacillus plantarum]|nr:hypothetical protein FET70_03390 [Lactiplantibacillus plantarum]
MIAKLPVSYWKASIFLNQIFIADKAYGTAKLRQYIEDKAGVYTIPQRKIPKTSGPVITTFIVSAID